MLYFISSSLKKKSAKIERASEETEAWRMCCSSYSHWEIKVKKKIVTRYPLQTYITDDHEIDVAIGVFPYHTVACFSHTFKTYGKRRLTVLRKSS